MTTTQREGGRHQWRYDRKKRIKKSPQSPAGASRENDTNIEMRLLSVLLFATLALAEDGRGGAWARRRRRLPDIGGGGGGFSQGRFGGGAGGGGGKSIGGPKLPNA